MRTKINYKEIKDYVAAQLTDKPDGTYALESGMEVDFSGQRFYQVSFETTENRKEMDAARFNKTVESLKELTGSEVYLGKFDNECELSFAVKSKQIAMKIAKQFNQHSIWDWKHSALILNPQFNSGTNQIYNY